MCVGVLIRITIKKLPDFNMYILLEITTNSLERLIGI